MATARRRRRSAKAPVTPTPTPTTRRALYPGTVLIPLAVYAGVMLLVLVGLPPLALVLVAAAAGAMCAWPVGKARVARSLVTYAGLHITLWLWNESVVSSVPYMGPGSGASAEEITATLREILSMEMVPPGNWLEVQWWFALAFLGAVGLTMATRPGTMGARIKPIILPLALTLGLLTLSLLPRVQGHLRLSMSFWGASGVLLVWQAVLFLRLRGASAGRSLESVFRPQHYVQAMVQVAVFAYWGWYWRPVYDFAVLLAAQLVFAYVFDMLLTWSRREKYVLGFGPFPIIFSINLFLWFRDDWFYLQFLMIGVGFLGKEFVRWHRAGRSVHIFNPSAFALGLFSLVLITTGTTHLTWGQDIASTLTLAPLIYLYLFLLGLVVMYFFSITLVTGSAAVVLFALSALYASLTGVPYFLDSDIPAAVFLGLHLLITDPSTSPRTPLGKLLFGGLYGAGVFGLYMILGAAGAPTFYDKLLAVPLLNLSVRGIDGLVQIARESPTLARLRVEWAPLASNLAHMGAWIVFFAAMTAMGKTDGKHTGDSLPFWEQACSQGRANACTRMIQLETTYCGDNSAWACNELGVHFRRGEVVASDSELARGYLARACELRFQAACVNLLDTDGFVRSDPRALDLRLLLREAGRNLMEMSEPDLYTRACDHDWAFACGR